MAAAGNDTCILEVNIMNKLLYHCSLPLLATVTEVKQQISLGTGFHAWRHRALYVLPQRTMLEYGQPLAAYGIMAGETRTLYLDLDKITVTATFIDYRLLFYPIQCYEWDTVMYFKMLIVRELRKEGVRDVGAEDMELSLNNGSLKLAYPGASLSYYGVRDKNWIEVKTTKEIRVPDVQRRSTSAL